jgi:hypothetical protein
MVAAGAQAYYRPMQRGAYLTRTDATRNIISRLTA